jgi:oligosaccharide repeat unit polymerase
MLLFLIALMALLVLGAMVLGYIQSRDVFHPVMLLGPILLFIYVWMPLKLNDSGALYRYFYPDQLLFVQSVNCLAVAGLMAGALFKAERKPDAGRPLALSENGERRLIIGGIVTGLIGFSAWLVSIRNVGGVSEAFSHPYSGGWDDSGYIRDGSLVMFAAVAIAMPIFAFGRRKLSALFVIAAFILPWMLQALFTSRRGPTFMIAAILLIGYCICKQVRPPILMVMAGAAFLGYGILFLVVNRSELYIGSHFNVKADVSSFWKQSDTGNEYLYGSGAMIGAHYTGNYFWGRRYIAQILIRPIPSSIWPTKYEDFGVAEVLQNAGTGSTIREALGWEGAPGSAPGLVADVWVEFSWLVIPVLWLIGRAYGMVWSRALQRNGMWASQYTVLCALSLYLVMQTLEAVIFRLLLMSIPIWLTWYWADRSTLSQAEQLSYIAVGGSV